MKVEECYKRLKISFPWELSRSWAIMRLNFTKWIKLRKIYHQRVETAHCEIYWDGKFWRNKAPGRPGLRLLTLISLVPRPRAWHGVDNWCCWINKWLIIISSCNPRAWELGGHFKISSIYRRQDWGSKEINNCFPDQDSMHSSFLHPFVH